MSRICWKISYLVQHVFAQDLMQAEQYFVENRLRRRLQDVTLDVRPTVCICNSCRQNLPSATLVVCLKHTTVMHLQHLVMHTQHCAHSGDQCTHTGVYKMCKIYTTTVEHNTTSQHNTKYCHNTTQRNTKLNFEINFQLLLPKKFGFNRSWLISKVKPVKLNSV